MGSRIAREVLPNGVNGTVEEGKRWAFRLQRRSGYGVQIQPARGFVTAVQVDARFATEVVRVLLKSVVSRVCGCLSVDPKKCERQHGGEHGG